jgi:hypothetical protein
MNFSYAEEFLADVAVYLTWGTLNNALLKVPQELSSLKIFIK